MAAVVGMGVVAFSSLLQDRSEMTLHCAAPTIVMSSVRHASQETDSKRLMHAKTSMFR